MNKLSDRTNKQITISRKTLWNFSVCKEKKTSNCKNTKQTSSKSKKESATKTLSKKSSNFTILTTKRKCSKSTDYMMIRLYKNIKSTPCKGFTTSSASNKSESTNSSEELITKMDWQQFFPL